jgi:hypothetical protein
VGKKKGSNINQNTFDHKETKTSSCETSTSIKEMKIIYDTRCQLRKGISKEVLPNFVFKATHHSL